MCSVCLLAAITCSTIMVRSSAPRFLNVFKFMIFNSLLVSCAGVSSASTQPFSPPLAFRVVARVAAKNEKSEIEEGKCHKCKKWIPLESIRDTELKVSPVSPPAILILSK